MNKDLKTSHYGKASPFSLPAFKTSAFLLLMLLFAGLTTVQAQIANVTSWNFGGQVWIRWEDNSTGPNIIGYRIYKIDTSSSIPNTWDAWTEIGSVFKEDATGERLRELTPLVTAGSNRALRYPNPNGNLLQLASNERLFVETPQQNQQVFYAIRRVRRVEVNPDSCFIENEAGVIDTPSVGPTPLDFAFSSGIRIQPVLQKAAEYHTEIKDSVGVLQPDTFPYKIYCHWIDGKSDHASGRADYPVMGSASRNGVPFFFVVWEPSGGLPPDFGAVHALHGGGGKASNWKPGAGWAIDLVPNNNIMISHDDNNFNVLGGECWPIQKHTWWFGYPSQYDAFQFVSLNRSLAQAGDSVINYTQRRVMWVQDWLINGGQYSGFSPAYTAIMGFSLGGHGTSHISRAFPDTFSTATMFSYNPRSPGPTGLNASWRKRAFGAGLSPSPRTNLVNSDGPVLIQDVWNYNNRISTSRDLPILRHIHGRLDTNDLQAWDANLVEQVLKMDEGGDGLNFFWDGRKHVAFKPNRYFAAAPYGFDDKTVQTDLHWQMRFRNDYSYPGFYLFDADPGAGRLPDIGTGLPTNADNKGSFGGFIGWENPYEDSQEWYVDAFLISNEPEYSDKDACLWDSATAYMTVRRNQFFTPAGGTQINYFIYNPDNTLERFGNGQVTVETDGLIRLEDSIKLFQGKKTRIHFLLSGTPKNGSVTGFGTDELKDFEAWPNPVVDGQLHLRLPEAGGTVELRDLTGRLLKVYGDLEGLQVYTVNLPYGTDGVYFLNYLVQGRRVAVRKLMVR